MAMPEFLDNIEAAEKDSTGWLAPSTVAGLLESDFHTLKPDQREKLFQAVERFRAVAVMPSPGAEERAKARVALDAILGIVQPYLTPENKKIRDTIVKVWRPERDWMPTFDYKLGNNWLDRPVVWMWFVVKDDVVPEDVGTPNPALRAGMWRVQSGLLDGFNIGGIERTPLTGIRTESDVKELQARAVA